MRSSPRLRIVAGPNGSGKSTIKSILDSQMWGIYVNPDDLEKDIRDTGQLDISRFDIQTSGKEVSEFLSRSRLLQAGLFDRGNPVVADDKILFGKHNHINSYMASAIADFVRQKLLVSGHSFTFETVMSSTDKIDFIVKAKQLGYRVYLYYIATEDPSINISRIQIRISQGGHPVPDDKVISRYARSLDLLRDAIHHSDRAYIFDNSSHERTWIAEITNGKQLEYKTDKLPLWFQKAVLEKRSK